MIIDCYGPARLSRSAPDPLATPPKAPVPEGRLDHHRETVAMKGAGLRRARG
ncbi:hypothetical protein AB0O39_03770 [Streptomyces anulatus]|uniref:hypothetical protein n=1 Tax=Streptomyces anulatus TaxID=1892 RepID=UPI0034120FE3